MSTTTPCARVAPHTRSRHPGRGGPSGRRALLLAATLVVGVGGTALAQQGDNGRGGTGLRPPDLPTHPNGNRPQPPPPPEAVADLERRRAAAARGERIPMAVWDPRTNDLMRHPDGRLVMDTELPDAGPQLIPPCHVTRRGCNP